ncbi:60S ribosomal protein L3-1 [Abeliophyllum distichum]|uniref:60S ribosomal protein L3-1 n=1 Tax=Abeliophyllum distichum TaxID=126358 RepID=A0ABD1SV24_9LAMI
MKGLKQKKAHLMEIQVNGGTVAKKVDYVIVFEEQVPVDAIFQKDEMIDIIGVTKGKGLGKVGQESHAAVTMFDRTKKDITPIGGFPHYGIVKDDFLIIKGCCVRPKKRVVTLRQSLLTQISRLALEEIKLKFINTSSKFGNAASRLLKRSRNSMDALKHNGRYFEILTWPVILFGLLSF